MLCQAYDTGFLHDLNIKGGLNAIRCLQFADDTLIVSKALPADITNIKLILYLFEQVSGLGINYTKSSIFYLGRDQSKGARLANLLNCKLGKLPFTYLGLPLASGSMHKKEWEPLLEKFQKRLSSWKSKSLSIGGRLTLLNSVLSALPLYFISFFKLPIWVTKKINSIRSRFLWGTSSFVSSRKHLVRWNEVCAPRDEGGSGRPRPLLLQRLPSYQMVMAMLEP